MYQASSAVKEESIQESKHVTNSDSVWGHSRDSDELRLSKAYRLISNIANSLNLPKFIEEVRKCHQGSQRLYKLAQSKNWVQGRHTSHVVAAAMYIVCRKEKDSSPSHRLL